jgi:dimethylglycine dehydrogenase
MIVLRIDAEDTDVNAYEPVWIDGTVKGFCTSGGYSHHLGASLAFALVPRADVSPDLTAKVEILGQMRDARIMMQPEFDPEGRRLRG